MADQTDVIIIGGGIVGLATAYRLLQRMPRLNVLVLEKEEQVAFHQTGHNSGVIHSGLYYRPGSIKAINCAKGREALIRFAKKYHIPHEMCGKILVATSSKEQGFLDDIEATGRKNGLHDIERIGPERIRDIEPHCRGIEGLWVPYTGIIDYGEVGLTLVDRILRQGGDAARVLTNHEVLDLDMREDRVFLKTNQGHLQARYVISCAGLQSDRIARKDGLRLNMRIVPFRGDYFELIPEAENKVRHLIYPVPNPALPFLGVHFTRMVGGVVECGPSAVFSFKREGYRKTDFSVQDTWDSLTYWGTYRLFLRHWAYGLGEMARAFSKKIFLQALRRLIPDLQMREIKSSRAGIRAQALDGKGDLLDDFRIEATDHSLHVLNAPSPAATASLAIGDTLVQMASERFDLKRG